MLVQKTTGNPDWNLMSFRTHRTSGDRKRITVDFDLIYRGDNNLQVDFLKMYKTLQLDTALPLVENAAKHLILVKG